MSIKTKFGWAIAVALGILLSMTIAAIVAAQPCWGAKFHTKHGERVHYYTIMVACTENRIYCIKLPIDEFDTFDRCETRIKEIKENQDLYGIPAHPVVLGRCVSWSPPFGNSKL